VCIEIAAMRWNEYCKVLAMANKTILLIEDDPALAETTASVLSLRNFRVIWAQTAQQAFAHLVEMDHDDLVLLDLALGNDRGEDVVARCRECGVSMPPIIISSAQDPAECHLAMQKTKAVGCLAKPYSGSQLLETVSRVLGECD
jgi:DNA-binding response OmpR family regulator